MKFKLTMEDVMHWLLIFSGTVVIGYASSNITLTCIGILCIQLGWIVKTKLKAD